ncbi:MAG: VWA domain-containing protein [Ignavibacteria bacterium]|nr:VWA domain-containing protein [Ignavibacteria bacterium]
MPRTFCLLPLFAVLMIGTAISQPRLNFKRIVNNWPTIELYMQPTCKGAPLYFTDRRYFSVRENGVEVDEFELWCPDPVIRCAVSMSFAIEIGSRTSDTALGSMRKFCKAMISNFDGEYDEALITVAGKPPYTAQGMTTSKDILNNGIDAISSAGPSAIWDGAYTALQELVNNGVNPCRAVVLISTGHDSGSVHTTQEVIKFANRNRIRVFTCGMGDSGLESGLKNVADLTGGRYFRSEFITSQSMLAAQRLYEEVSTIIFSCGGGCIVTYQAKHMDGTLRTVDFTVKDICGGSCTETKTYKAPKDTSTYLPLSMRLGKVLAHGGDTAVVPLELLTALSPPDTAHPFRPAVFRVLFDETVCCLLDIAAPAGTLLADVPVLMTRIPGGLEFRTTESRVFDVPAPPATLALLRFTTRKWESRDTVCAALELSSWRFDGGEYKPLLTNGSICILPFQPVINCSPMAPPSLRWDAATNSYTPNPFTFTHVMGNTGDATARNARVRLDVDPASFVLVSPKSDTRPSMPADIGPGKLSEARWELLALPRSRGDSVRIGFTASFDNHDSIRCATLVWIPAAGLTGTEALPLAADLDMFPEPNRGSVTVRIRLDAAQTITLRVRNVLGQLVHESERLVPEGEHSFDIRLGDVPDGIYFLETSGGLARHVRRMTIIK